MTKINLDISNWKVKTRYRSRGRMKINVKLSKDEAEGFKNWSEAVRPPQISDDDFFRQIFFNGIEHLNFKLQDIARQVLSDPEMKKNLESSGINVSALEKAMLPDQQ